MGNKTPAILAGLFLSLGLAGTSRAADIDDDTKARQGVVRCGGNNFLRLNGTEIQFTAYVFRNMSSTTPITVERLTFFDAAGSVLFDSDTSGFPTFDDAILGPSDNVLEPNQTAQLNSFDVLPFLPQNLRPIQLEIVWSAPERVLTLEAIGVRISRQRDPVTGAQLAERGRDGNRCRTVDLRRH
jgi:hypothetical protein